jgi:hypothetical protein
MKIVASLNNAKNLETLHRLEDLLGELSARSRAAGA